MKPVRILVLLAALSASAGCGTSGPPKEPDPCAVGTFDDDGEPSTACVALTDCAPGRYVTAEGTPTSDRACAACAAGTFSADTNAAACTPHRSCPAGTLWIAEGSTTADTVCDPCEAGSFSIDTNATACTAWQTCPAGSYVSNTPNATEDRVCEPCDEGTFASMENATSCTAYRDCPPGTIVVGEGNDVEDVFCGTCASGTFSTEVNSLACTAWTDCPAGTRVTNTPSESEDRVCEDCLEGTQTLGQNESTCLAPEACPAGTEQTAAATASTPAVCSACDPGFHCAGGEEPPVVCEGDTWDHDSDPATACVAKIDCQAGSYVSSAGSATENRACALCSTGSFTSGTNELACLDWSVCEPGEHVVSEGTSTADRVCAPCDAGSFSDTQNAGTCTLHQTCVPGERMNLDGTSTTDRTCAACLAGTYSTTDNAALCTPWTACEAGSYELSSGTLTSDRVCQTLTLELHVSHQPSEQNATGFAMTSADDIYVAGSAWERFPDFSVERDVGVTRFDDLGNVTWYEETGYVTGGTEYQEQSAYVAVNAAGTDLYTVAHTNWAGNLSSGSMLFSIASPLNGAVIQSSLLTPDPTTATVVPNGVVLGEDGWVYAFGYTTGSVGGGVHLGGRDAFVARFDATTGALDWVEQLGTADDDEAQALAVDAQGNLHLAGITGGAFATFTNAGGDDVFLLRLDATRNVEWTQQWGSLSDDIVGGVLLGEGNVYIGRSGWSVMNVRAFDADTGTPGWNGPTWGPGGQCFLKWLVRAPDGGFYAAGRNYQAFSGNTSAGGIDVFVTKLSSTGQAVWTRQWGTSQDDFLAGIGVGVDGTIHAAGSTSGTFSGHSPPEDVLDAWLARLVWGP